MNNIYIFKLPVIVFAAFMLANCSGNQNDEKFTNSASIDTTTVLKVGDIKISAYAYQKSFDQFKVSYQQTTGRKPEGRDMENWKNDFIDRIFFLADAYKKGYDKDREINDRIKALGKMYLAQFGFNDLYIANPKKTFIQSKEEAERVKVKVADARVKANIRLNNTAINAFYNQLNKAQLDQHHNFSKDNFKSMLYDTLFTYTTPKKQLRVVTVSGFLDHYNSLTIKYDVFTRADVVNNLTSMADIDYAFNEAINRGLNKDLKYIADIELYKDKLIYDKYAYDVLAAGSVNEAEIKNVYNDIKTTLIKTTSAVASVFYLNNPKSAFAFSAMLRINPQVADTIKFNGLEKAYRHVVLSDTSKLLPGNVSKMVLNMTDKEVSRPVKEEQLYVVIKRETGKTTAVKTLDEARLEVIKLLSTQRTQINKPLILSNLKQTYPIELIKL